MMKKKIEREKTTSVGFFIWLSVIYERNNPIATSKAYWRLLRSIFAHIDFKYSILFFTLLNYFYLFFPPSLSLSFALLFVLFTLVLCIETEKKKKILFSPSPSPSLALTHILLYKYHQAKYWNRTSYESRRAGIVVLFSLSDFSFLLSFIIPLWNMGNKQAKTNSTELTPKRMSPLLIDFLFSIDWF